jgi:T-complex protein 1 subunit eta
MQTSVNNILEENLGKCELFEEKQVGDERYNVFTGCPRCVSLCVWITAAVTGFVGSTASQCVIKPPAGAFGWMGGPLLIVLCTCVRVCSAKTATIVLRGGSEQFIEESHRSIHDALMIVKVRMRPIRKLYKTFYWFSKDVLG